MRENRKYPVTYNTFKNRILEFFLEKDWNYNTTFTREQKQEFLDNHELDFTESYNEECQNYDKGLLNCFDTPSETHKYILGLLFDCEKYYAPQEAAKQSPKNKGYSMTYDEFEEKFLELLVKSATEQYNVSEQQVKKDFDNFVKENSDSVRYDYRERCQMYDYALVHSDEEYIIPADKVFSDDSLDSVPVYETLTWMYF